LTVGYKNHQVPVSNASSYAAKEIFCYKMLSVKRKERKCLNVTIYKAQYKWYFFSQLLLYQVVMAGILSLVPLHNFKT
jgi:hypothetical protein